MYKKIIVLIGLLMSGLITGDLLAKRKLKKLKKEYEKAEERNKYLMHTIALEKNILKLKEQDEDVKKYVQLSDKIVDLDPIKDYKQLNSILKEFAEENNIPCPLENWSFESFDKFMRDPNNKLRFI